MSDQLRFTWTTTDGLRLQGRWWLPKGLMAKGEAPKAVAAIVHGMGEHAGRFEGLADYLCSHGIGVIAFDQRGHGESDGPRGHSPSYDLLLESVGSLLRHAAQRYPATPVHLFGHSLGGNLALNYGLRISMRHSPADSGSTPPSDSVPPSDPALLPSDSPTPASIIASAPWLRLAFDPPAFQIRIAKLIGAIHPAFSQSTKLDATAISRDSAEVERYRRDPLIHDRISASMFFGAFQAGQWALDHADRLRIPTLVYHGTADRLTSAAASEAFHRSASAASASPATSVIFHPIEGGFHESHHEIEPVRSAAFRLISDWIIASSAS